MWPWSCWPWCLSDLGVSLTLVSVWPWWLCLTYRHWTLPIRYLVEGEQVGSREGVHGGYLTCMCTRSWQTWRVYERHPQLASIPVPIAPCTCTCVHHYTTRDSWIYLCVHPLWGQIHGLMATPGGCGTPVADGGGRGQGWVCCPPRLPLCWSYVIEYCTKQR